MDIPNIDRLRAEAVARAREAAREIQRRRDTERHSQRREARPAKPKSPAVIRRRKGSPDQVVRYGEGGGSNPLVESVRTSSTFHGAQREEVRQAVFLGTLHPSQESEEAPLRSWMWRSVAGRPKDWIETDRDSIVAEYLVGPIRDSLEKPTIPPEPWEIEASLRSWMHRGR